MLIGHSPKDYMEAQSPNADSAHASNEHNRQEACNRPVIAGRRRTTVAIVGLLHSSPSSHVPRNIYLGAYIPRGRNDSRKNRTLLHENTRNASTQPLDILSLTG